MRIREVRELKFHRTFFLFPVNPTFFYASSVGSVVFVSHRQVCEVSRAGKVSAKKPRKAGKIFCTNLRLDLSGS